MSREAGPEFAPRCTVEQAADQLVHRLSCSARKYASEGYLLRTTLEAIESQGTMLATMEVLRAGLVVAVTDGRLSYDPREWRLSSAPRVPRSHLAGPEPIPSFDETPWVYLR